jgi:hypothetical protein
MKYFPTRAVEGEDSSQTATGTIGGKTKFQEPVQLLVYINKKIIAP